MQNLATALADFHSEVGKILKQSDAQYGKYADLATVLATVTPALSSKNLVVTQTFMPLEVGTSTTVLRTTLWHSSGESISSDLPMPNAEAQRNALHAFGAATTYLRRYALLAILNLAAEDDDGCSFADGHADAAKAMPKSGTGTQLNPHKRTVAVGSSINPGKLSQTERNSLIAQIKGIDETRITVLCDAFRKRFDLAPEVKISEHLKTKAHGDFITEWIASNPAAVVA
ncbi:MAG: ERF family protein [Hylemonella sp.]